MHIMVCNSLSALSDGEGARRQTGTSLLPSQFTHRAQGLAMTEPRYDPDERFSLGEEVRTFSRGCLGVEQTEEPSEDDEG